MERFRWFLTVSPSAVEKPKPAASDDCAPVANVTSPMPKSCDVRVVSKLPITRLPARGAAAVCWLPVVVPPSSVPSSTRPFVPPFSASFSAPPSAPSVKSGRLMLAPINRFEKVWL